MKAELFHSGVELSWRSQTVETQHDVQFGADVLWKEQFEWYYEEEDLSFIRFVVCDSLDSPPSNLLTLCCSKAHDLCDRIGDR